MNRSEAISRIVKDLLSSSDVDSSLVSGWLEHLVPPQVEHILTSDTFPEEVSSGNEILDVILISHDKRVTTMTIYVDQVSAQTFLASRIQGVELDIGEGYAWLSIQKPQSGKWGLAVEPTQKNIAELGNFASILLGLSER